MTNEWIIQNNGKVSENKLAAYPQQNLGSYFLYEIKEIKIGSYKMHC